jgi:hypothetical protein
MEEEKEEAINNFLPVKSQDLSKSFLVYWDVMFYIEFLDF